MKKRLPTIILSVIFIIGLVLILYPTVSDYYNSLHQSRAVADYSEQVANLDDDKYAEYLEEARLYNEKLAERSHLSFTLSDEEMAEYEGTLDVSDVISYIEIPSIRVKLPIYHGTSESVLGIGVGHVAGSSLPVGGKGTHCVLSGHRGLPEAKLFTDLDQLSEGDVFMLQTLDETLTYEVDQILVVDPEDVESLEIVPGMDYCTLVTCTPYGINTQRLLVRGHRVENASSTDTVRVTADGVQIEPILVAPFVVVPILAVMLIWVFNAPGSRKKKNKKG